MLTKIKFAPGIDKQDTSVGAVGRWVDSDLARFRYGLPEKIGGWSKVSTTTFIGVARAQLAWNSLDGTAYDIFGTHKKLYVYSEGNFFDATPQRSTADITSVFTTTNAYYGMHSANHSDEITALMLRLKSKSALVMLPRVFDSRADEQGAFPVFIFAQLQKQWAPVLKNLESYSILVPVVLLILFMLVVLYLGNTERITQRFLFLQKRSTRHILMYCHGLALIMVILGSLISYIVLRGTFNFYNHHEDGLVLLPICLSIIIFTILSRRK